MSEEVRTAFVWDTRGVEAGAQKIEKAFDRVGAAEKESMRPPSSAGTREQDGYHRRAIDARKKFHGDVEREIKAHHGRVSALERAHGRGSAGRYFGDLLNIGTGTSGNVMRLNALTHGGLSLGSGIAGLLAGGVAAAGVSAANNAAERTRELQFATGASVENPLWRGAGGAFLRNAPPGLFDQFRVGRGDASSLGGMRGQRAEIAGALKSSIDSQKGIMGWSGSGFGDMLAPLTGGPNSAEKIQAMQAGYEKLLALDKRIAAVSGEQSAIERTRLTDSEHQAKLDQIRLETAEKIKDIADQGREDKAGLSERRQATMDAKEMEKIQIALAEQEHDAAVDELNTRKAIAYFRGGVSDKAVQAAEQELGLAQRTLDNAKQVTAEKRRQLVLNLAHAQAAKDALDLSVAAQRGQEKATERIGQMNLVAGKGRINADLFSPDEHRRFAAQQAVSRMAAGAGVAGARENLAQASKEAEAEKTAHSGVLSPETAHRLEMARQQVGAQENAFRENEMGLKAEQTERREARFMTPEGRPRRLAAVMTEERKRLATAARFQRARDRFDKSPEVGLHSGGLTSGGLVTGSTFDRPSPADEYARKETRAQRATAAAAAVEEASPKVTNLRLGTIIEILQERLPAK